MEIDLVIKNYRCFPDNRPARIHIRPGFTAFLGVNNSGKSTLLKLFYELRHLFEMIQENSTNVINGLKGAPQSFKLPPTIEDINQIFCRSNDRNIEIQMKVSAGNPKTETIPDALVITIPRGTNSFSLQLVLDQIGKFDPSRLGFQDQSFIRITPSGPSVNFSEYFEAFKEFAKCLYIGPFRNAINVGTNKDYFDIKVGQAFVEQWRNWKTGSVISQNEATKNLQKEIGHIFEFDDLEINPSTDNSTLQVFVNERSYRLYELGSGLTQFILVFANAVVQRPPYILIDEPELNLHPSLQLDFLTTLASYARKGIIFGTHNIGLARASADRIYGLRKHAEGECEVSNFDGMRSLSEFVGELSYSGYRELGFDKILLVEGSTEVRTIQQFLRLYKKDHKIVLLPLGGSQMINRDREMELQEILRVSPNVLALIDSERDRSQDPLGGNREGFVTACQKVGIKCHVLDWRSTENYLAEAAIKRIKGGNYRALTPYQKLDEVDPRWSKSENWRIAREMVRDDLERTDLGAFLESL